MPHLHREEFQVLCYVTDCDHLVGGLQVTGSRAGMETERELVLLLQVSSFEISGV